MTDDRVPPALRAAIDAPNPPVFDDYDKTPERVYFCRDRARAMAAALRWALANTEYGNRQLRDAIAALEQEAGR